MNFRFFLAMLLWLASAAAHALPSTLATLTLGDDTAAVGTDAVLNRAYVTNYTSGTLSVISLDPSAVLATIPVGANPRRALVDSAHHLVYLVNDTTPGALTIVDAGTNTVVGQVPVGSRPRALAADFQLGEVYVVNRDGNSVSVVSTATRTVVATIPVGHVPTSVDVNTSLGKIYVTSPSDGAITVIDQATRTTKAIGVGRNPSFPRVDERTAKVYVNNVDDKTLSVIDSRTDTVIRTLPTGAGTANNFAIASAVYRRVYLPNQLDGTLTIVNTDTDTVVRTVAVGTSPQDAVLDASHADLYVVNAGSNSVTILDARSEAVTGSLAVGGVPWRATAALDRLLVLNTNGAAPDSITIATQQQTLADTAIATEWYHAGFDHYFHSAQEPENRVLGDGLFGNAWNRTLQFWRVWTQPGPGRLPVCRFFSASFAPRSSHFFTPYAPECAGLQAGNVWLYEGTLYFLALPDATGACSPGTAPLYRLYNNGQGGAPNHRLTPDAGIRNQMLAAGWVGEGNGPDTVFACTPTLRGD